MYEPSMLIDENNGKIVFKIVYLIAKFKRTPARLLDLQSFNIWIEPYLLYRTYFPEWAQENRISNILE